MPQSNYLRQAPGGVPGVVGVGGVPGTKPRPNPSAAPAIQYTPNELSIPSKLYDKVPNLELYKKLTEAEKDIDVVTTKKELDFHVMHAKSMQPSNFKRETGVLRVFIYNVCENQPWQKQLAQQQGKEVDPSAEGSWTLKVEGRFLPDDKSPDVEADSDTRRRFSSFLSGLSVDLIPNEDYPTLTENNSHIIEWRDGFNQYQPQRSNEFDGMDIKRNGIFNLKSRIAIMVKDQSSKLKLTEKMSYFVGKHEITQQELIYSIWQYVLYKDLIIKKDVSQVDTITNTTPGLNDVTGTQSNVEQDLTAIKCDDILEDVLGVEQFRFADLYKLIQPHFEPRQPILFDYEVNTRKSTTLGDLVVDIPVELPLEIARLQKEVSEENKKIFTESTQLINEIATINSKIALGISQLNNLSSRHQFYKELTEDPVEFVKNWSKVQLETLKSLKSDEGYDEELVRRAEYFEKNEELVRDKVDLLLGSTKF